MNRSRPGWLRRVGEFLAGPRVRAYEGADRGRRTAGWRSGGTSANAEIARAAPTLRGRSRDLVRNDAHAAKAITELASAVVGSGIRPIWQTGSEALDRAVNALWSDWCAEASTDRQLSFYGLQLQAVRGMFESGETLTRRRPRRAEDGLTVPLQLQVVEAELLDESKNESTGDAAASRILRGIEFDALDRRVGYWLLPVHPGETGLTATGAAVVGGRFFSSSNRVAASEIAHLFVPDRPGQVRGAPWLAPAILRLRDLDEYRDSEILRKKASACLVGTVRNIGVDSVAVGDQSDTVTDLAGNAVETIEPGTFYRAPDGRQIDFHQPTSTADYDAYVRTELRGVSAGARLPYALLTGDLSDTNYSSLRAGMLAFGRLIQTIQREVVIHQWCRPVAGWWLAAAQAAGKIPANDGIWAQWSLPRTEYLDRTKESTADVDEVRAGLVPWSEAVTRRGDDPDEVFDALVRDRDRFEAAGLFVETDARVPRATGTQNTAAAVAKPPPAGADDDAPDDDAEDDATP